MIAWNTFRPNKRTYPRYLTLKYSYWDWVAHCRNNSARTKPYLCYQRHLYQFSSSSKSVFPGPNIAITSPSTVIKTAAINRNSNICHTGTRKVQVLAKQRQNEKPLLLEWCCCVVKSYPSLTVTVEASSNDPTLDICLWVKIWLANRHKIQPVQSGENFCIQDFRFRSP